MPHLNGVVSHLLTKYLDLFHSLGVDREVLDLACGSGRNGLFLIENNIRVKFVDKNEKALAEIYSSIKKNRGQRSKCLQTDLEKGENSLFEPERFGAISIRSSILKGGLIFYETFTTANTEFGKPKNPNYLLKEGELLEKFEGWEIIEYFEGIKLDPQRSIASIVARKP